VTIVRLVGALAVAVVGSVVTLAIALVLSLETLGRYVTDRHARVDPLLRASLGLVVAVVAGGAIVGVCMWAAFRFVGGRNPRPGRTIGAFAGGAMVLLCVAWTVALAREARNTIPRIDPTSSGRYDVLLVTDRSSFADPAVLAELDRITPPPPSIAGWDVAFAIAIVSDRGVRVALPMTESDADAKEVLREIAARRSRLSATGVASATPAALGLPAVGWRAGSQRAVAPLVGPGESAPVGAGALRAAIGLPLLLPEVDLTQAWREWAQAARGRIVHVGRTSELNPVDAALAAVTAQPTRAEYELAFRYRPSLLFDSKEFYRPLDVDSVLSERNVDGRAVARVCDRRVLRGDSCVPLLTAYDLGRRSDYIDLGGKLRYGSDSRTSVDLIRAATAPPQSTGLPPGVPPPPNVPPPGGGAGLTIRRLCTPTPEGRECDGGPWSRVYFHLVRAPRRLTIDYWWYFRFNVTPNKTALMCRSGLSVSDLDCFDHESDWEGISVTLARVCHGRLKPVSVTYAGHAWRYRFHWDDLVKAKRVERRTHPRVYVAFGSHASYPVPCYGRTESSLAHDCFQGRYRRSFLGGLVKTPLPDGRRDGARRWSMDDDRNCVEVGCLSELPLRIDGRGARWNAFRGRWGAAECSLPPKICVRAEGPETPSAQPRYSAPEDAPWQTLSPAAVSGGSGGGR
jgi:hypothetical protein